MAFNLIIAYDLMSPGQNYEAVQSRIKELGKHIKLQYSLYYVHTTYTPQQAAAHIEGAMDANDKLAVSNIQLVQLVGYNQSVVDAINGVWSKAA